MGRGLLKDGDKSKSVGLPQLTLKYLEVRFKYFMIHARLFFYNLTPTNLLYADLRNNFLFINRGSVFKLHTGD